MIFITYVGSGALLAVTAILFYHHKLTAFTQTYVREKNGGRQEEKRKKRGERQLSILISSLQTGVVNHLFLCERWSK